MKPERSHAQVRAELDQLLREGLLDPATHRELARRYPVADWHWRALGRWFLIFGGLSLAAGLVILGRSLFEFTLAKLAVLLGLVAAGCFAGGWRLRGQPWVWTRRSLELLGGLALIGWSFTLAALYSDGSGNWPAVLLANLPFLLPLAYGLRNPLLLVLSAVVFFTGFGGVTGYVSGWGAYWFGMNDPLRFLVAGTLVALAGVAHRLAERETLRRYEGFFQIWLSSGVFFAEMALWLMSLYGNFGALSDWDSREQPGELLFFNLLWAGANLALLRLGARHGLRMLRGYAVTFLIVQGYTLFFRYVAGHIGLVATLFVAGGAALGLVGRLESLRKSGRDGSPE